MAASGPYPGPPPGLKKVVVKDPFTVKDTFYNVVDHSVVDEVQLASRETMKARRATIKNTFIHVNDEEPDPPTGVNGRRNVIWSWPRRFDDGGSYADSAAPETSATVLPPVPEAEERRHVEERSNVGKLKEERSAEKRSHVEKLKEERRKHVEELELMEFFRTRGAETTESEFERFQASDEFINLLRKHDIEDVPRNWVSDVKGKGRCRVARLGGRLFYEEPAEGNRLHGWLVEQEGRKDSVSCWRGRLFYDELPRDDPSGSKYARDIQVRMLSSDRMETRMKCMDERGVEDCDWQPPPILWSLAPRPAVAEASYEEDRSFFEQVMATGKGANGGDVKEEDMFSSGERLKVDSLKSICAMVMVYRRSKKDDHKSRLCEPCEYFHKAKLEEGRPCAKGVNCPFCHVYSTGERNRFKKAMAKEKWNNLQTDDKERKMKNREEKRREKKKERARHGAEQAR